MEFEDNIHLDPELTWEECAKYVYDGVMDGKLTREDFIEFFIISGQEFHEPRHTRIFAKALGAFFKRDYPDIKSDEKPGVLVKVDNNNFIVTPTEDEIVIQEANDLENVQDSSFLILHDTEADAQISAWENGEKYIERIGD